MQNPSPNSTGQAAVPGSTESRRPLAILVPYTYTVRGVEKQGWTEVGTAFRNKNGSGFHCDTRPGISISGRFVLIEKDAKDKTNQGSSSTGEREEDGQVGEGRGGPNG